LPQGEPSDEELESQVTQEENEDLNEEKQQDIANARCRFGTPANYAIVDA